MLLTAAILSVALFVVLTPVGKAFGFEPLPLVFFPILLFFIVTYMILTQVIKMYLLKRKIIT